MGIDELITLEDGKDYVLLLKSSYENNNYFMATLLINNEPSDTYTIFKEVIDKNQILVEEIKDDELLKKLSEDFNKQLDLIGED